MYIILDEFCMFPSGEMSRTLGLTFLFVQKSFFSSPLFASWSLHIVFVANGLLSATCCQLKHRIGSLLLFSIRSCFCIILRLTIELACVCSVPAKAAISSPIWVPKLVHAVRCDHHCFSTFQIRTPLLMYLVNLWRLKNSSALFLKTCQHTRCTYKQIRCLMRAFPR